MEKTFYILDKDGLRLYDYTKNADKAEDYELDGYAIFTNLTEVCELIDANAMKHYCTPWNECSEEHYYDMLGVLPPLVQHSNGFVMSEFTTGRITSFYVEHEGRYFHALRNVDVTTLGDAVGEVKLMLS